MGEHLITMPDVGEGIAEAELAEWFVTVGELVHEDTVLAAVTTDKATAELPSPVTGRVVWLGGEAGDIVAVGAPLIRLAVEDAGDADQVPDGLPIPNADPPSPAPGHDPAAAHREGEKASASPAVRHRARKAGIDLGRVPGSGPSGRVTHEDLDAYLTGDARGTGTPSLRPNTTVEQIKVTGVRRKIAEKMTLAASRIPHITYVEEVDVTALEDLRSTLNANRRAERPKLTLLPFLMQALVRAIADQPHLNALYDDEAGILHQHGSVHVGVATQTPAGLVVPVVRHVEARDLWDCGAELTRVTEAARTGSATRQELGGSTITVTSLGALGGIASTPIINHPEVAIIGVNRIATRPVWNGAAFIPRKMMNLSSSFDHRVIDGWDAAVFVQRIKTLLETPALIFVDA
ncbi:Lipoamide acyltransferase component of branched-chain alpha-keto acid dehydrogenase complex [Methylobacterium tardum]|uniref:Dihydrolipoamide acetyltransferase component of pyruvate dehydrogenase complex n=1 Tax=Methylobacterium tardum TaxID=374432 RepID=A0AA37T8U0_9HYPH|nr:dihydrolipoamide acetyltransferase family protein [Methylobacterium tardum]GJE52333.1 Lipoamide acyltransferase component of branched-chain alpha-keto acid dehydrogenase complex [Methylobacterium tardum]GLS69065.1 dihydrolipoamide acetyltransferase component of pyruvate dehydrogenase complex [Methylobacterium tardum]